MDNKKERYEKLVKKIHNCNCCKSIKKPIFCNDGVCLINMPNECKNIMNHVNMWNYWQGSLDAKIMVIGQDYGKFPGIESKGKNNKNREHYLEEYIRGEVFTKHLTLENDIEENYKELRKIWSTTDTNLFYLFKKVLGYDLTKVNEDLFFTNMACCYRNRGDATSGADKFCSEWLSLCANKYMGELIDIIQPKVIITLGEKTFNAMTCIDGLELKCIDSVSLDKGEKVKFVDVIEHNYELVCGVDKSIRVFPVYHPGANSNINRKLKEIDANKKGQSQESDWWKIKRYIDENSINS